MNDIKFVNLHTHTEYSSLDGYIRIGKLIDKVAEFNQPAIAITDHGTMSGILEFFNAIEYHNKAHPEKKIKPIIGMEAYVVKNRTQRVKGEFNRHLIMLARNQKGYKNLLKLHYEGYATGATNVYDRIIPRIDHSLLTRESCEGIIALSACIGGEVPQLLLNDNWKEAAELVAYYQSVFDAFYLELQPTDVIGEDQVKTNALLIQLAQSINVPLVATTDSHYLTPEEDFAHQLVLAIQSKKDVYDEERFTFKSTPLRSTEEMLTAFSEEIVANTQKIAEMCEYPDYLRFKGYRLPKYIIVENEEYNKWKVGKFEQEDESYKYCRYLVEKNWNGKLKYIKGNAKKEKEYKDRIELEIETVKGMGFVDYFLIVQDFVEWCKDNGIMTGVARGSAGGSLLSYILGITKLDPLKYDLLFSRFLNKDRISLPDIDMDIDKERRDEVKAYLARKYGQDRVASIATFGRMKVRACIKDIVRSLKIGGSRSASFEIADDINKTIEKESPDLTYKEAIEIPEFKAYMIKYKEVAKYAQEFEDLIRQTGIHAAGTIIGAEPLVESIPMMVDKRGIISTAYDGTTLDKDGFLKIDLLGLKNLTIITDAIKNIKKTRNEVFKGFPLMGVDIGVDEPEDVWARKVAVVPESVQKVSKTYKMLREGRSAAVFQVESQAMRELLKSVQVNSIEDLSVVLALCRPGPLASGLTAEFGKRKSSGEDLDEWYLHPSLRPILGKTYGIFCYQEQCMQVAVKCAGFTEPEADTLRKAIGKKIRDLMEKFEQKFLDGCAKYSGMSETVAQQVWDLIKQFADYGFNKCLSGDTELLVTDGRVIKIEDLAGEDCSKIKLWSKDKQGRIIKNQVVEAFCTGENEVFEIELDNGLKVCCTMQHKFLCTDGKFYIVEEILKESKEIE